MPFFSKVKKDTRKIKKTAKAGFGQGIQANKVQSIQNKREAFRQRLDAQLSRDEVVSSSDDEDIIRRVKKFKPNDHEDPEDVETAEQKKERLSQEFIEELKSQKVEEESDKQIQQQLREDVLQSQGKLFRTVAHNYSQLKLEYNTTQMQSKKFQRKEISCVSVNPEDGSIFSSSLDGSIVKYSQSGATLGIIKSLYQDPGSSEIRHAKPVNAIAVSTNGKYLASGDSGGIIHIWDASTLSHRETFEKHRGSVTGLAFQKDGLSLYSCGLDRLVMEWSMDSMAYVDNLGGHSCGVQGIDALYRQSCISCGGEDETIIIYSVLEDKQFQFSAKQTSVDGVKLLNESTFLTYGQDGSLCLWSTTRKRALQTLRAAHGLQSGPSKEPNWISALAALVNTDLVASGSCDGFVRLWRVIVTPGNSSLRAMARIPVPNGVVNSLDFTPDGTGLVVGIGRSHKRGRWFVTKQSKSVVVLIKFINVEPLPCNAKLKFLKKQQAADAEVCSDESSDDDQDDESSLDSGNGVSNNNSNEDIAEDQQQQTEEDESTSGEEMEQDLNDSEGSMEEELDDEQEESAVESDDQE